MTNNSERGDGGETGIRTLGALERVTLSSSAAARVAVDWTVILAGVIGILVVLTWSWYRVVRVATRF